jgi:hypothetical protein
LREGRGVPVELVWSDDLRLPSSVPNLEKGFELGAPATAGLGAEEDEDADGAGDDGFRGCPPVELAVSSDLGAAGAEEPSLARRLARIWCWESAS